MGYYSNSVEMPKKDEDDPRLEESEKALEVFEEGEEDPLGDEVEEIRANLLERMDVLIQESNLSGQEKQDAYLRAMKAIEDKITEEADVWVNEMTDLLDAGKDEELSKYKIDLTNELIREIGFELGL